VNEEWGEAGWIWVLGDFKGWVPLGWGLGLGVRGVIGEEELKQYFFAHNHLLPSSNSEYDSS
jgi:hypothetical protein